MESATVNFVNLQFVGDYYYFGGTLDAVDVDFEDFGSWSGAASVRVTRYLNGAMRWFSLILIGWVGLFLLSATKKGAMAGLKFWFSWGITLIFLVVPPVLGILMFTTVQEHVTKLTCLWKDLGLVVPVFFTVFHEVSGVHVD